MPTRSLQSPKLTLNMSCTVRNTLDGSLGNADHGLSSSNSITLTSGVNGRQANRAIQISLSIATGTYTIIDLYDLLGDDPIDVGAGVGNDALGQAWIAEEIVAILVMNNNAYDADGQLEVKPASTAGWSPIGTHTVANGGALRGQGKLYKEQQAEAGFDVTDASSHRLRLEASGGTVAALVTIFARHDDEESSSESSSTSSSSSSSFSSSSSSVSSSSSSVSTSSVSSSSSSSSSVSTSSASSLSSSSSSVSSSSSSSVSTSSSSSSSSSSESSSSQS